MNYYNEHDQKTAAWLRSLILAGAIPDGHVDERSIADVHPSDLRGYTQCHFFAGIGGWSYALQLAGWLSDRPVWTGSCPCQPFSTAGKGLAQADERHLWPVFFDLIRQRRPEHVFGEQVASAIGHGWLDGVSADLEAEGYACGAAVLGAHSVNSPHQRQRLYWVAESNQGRREVQNKQHWDGRKEACQRKTNQFGAGSPSDGLAHNEGSELQRERAVESRMQSGPANGGGLVLPNGNRCSAGSHAASPAGHGHSVVPAGDHGGLADAQHAERRSIHEHRQNECHGQDLGWQETHRQPGTRGEICGPWSVFDLIPCRDGKTRRIESGTFPLAHGIPARVVRLRGYGNAIVPQVAAEFIAAFLDIQDD